MKYLLFVLSLLQLTTLASTPKGVYGEDNRVEVNLHPDKRVRELSKSVAGIFYRSHLKPKGERFEIAVGIYGEVYKYCSDVPFVGQPSASNCTAFLIAPNMVMTAGHCVSSEWQCKSQVFAFDYKIENIYGPFAPYDRHEFETKNLYNCKRIVKTVTDKKGSKLDYAIIELDRDVEGREPLKLRRWGKIKNKTPVFMIGTPSGLPLKVADHARVFENKNPIFFRTNLDAFHNNSGAPVFNAKSFKVEGILVRGRADYDSMYGCKSIKKCTTKECPLGEEVTRILKTNYK